MKKYLVLIGAVVLVLALGSPSMAQFKSWGHLEVQTVWVTKPDLNTGMSTPFNTVPTFTQQNSSGSAPAADSDVSTKQIFERFRFYLQYGDPKTVRAVLGFEADSYNWGERPFSSTEEFGSGSYGAAPPAGGFGRMGVVGTDQIQLKIMHAYVDFVVPNTPVRAMIGLVPFNVGGILFLSKDVPGVTITADFAPHKVELYWYREWDKNLNAYAVNDTYGAQYSMAQKLFNIYLYGFYKNDLTSTDFTVASGFHYDDHPYWVGVGGGFRPGNWDLSGQFVYNGGKRENKSVIADQDYAAWQGMASAKYRIGPGLVVAGDVFYSTGNDADDTSKIKRFQFPISPKVGNPSEVLWGMGADRSVFYYFNWDLNYVSGLNLDYTGTWFGNLRVEYNPVAWVNLNFNWLYIGDTSKGSPANVATGGVINSPGGARTDSDKDYVGQELDVIAKIKIYEPLYYNIGLGYFFPGDVYDTATRSADNGWALNTKLIYVF